MRLNTLKPAAGATRARKRVGRGAGSGYGGTAGRGHKGQKSRSGGKLRVGFEGGQMPLQRRLPKRGFRSRIKRFSAEIRLHELAKVDGDVVDLPALRQAGLIGVHIKRAKAILSGEITRAVTLRGVAATAGAKAAIEAAGGVVEAMPAEMKVKKLAKKPRTIAAEAEKAAAKAVAEAAADEAAEAADVAAEIDDDADAGEADADAAAQTEGKE